MSQASKEACKYSSRNTWVEKKIPHFSWGVKERSREGVDIPSVDGAEIQHL